VLTAGLAVGLSSLAGPRGRPNRDRDARITIRSPARVSGNPHTD
jgi:hypothetical protein